ncbi:MAG: RluA family pseudouridine synthase [Alphaproteobacteria bacterium]
MQTHRFIFEPIEDLPPQETQAQENDVQQTEEPAPIIIQLKPRPPRLDVFMAGELADFSRTKIKNLIQKGVVSLDGIVVTDPSFLLKEKVEISFIEPEAVPLELTAENIPLNIVYEDDDLVVVDKKAGMVVHTAAGHFSGTLVNALLYHCGDSLSGIGGVKRPGIVHRIDKETSGLLVVAKNDVAHVHLAAQFFNHSIARRYKALVWGVPSPPTGTIEGAIARHPKNRQKMAIVPHGKDATTHYKLLEAFQMDASLVECRLETGRTHQIRVHMTDLGHGLIGDKTYGRTTPARTRNMTDEQKEMLKSFPRQALHAYELGFIHPRTKEKMLFESPLHDDMADILQILRKSA